MYHLDKTKERKEDELRNSNNNKKKDQEMDGGGKELGDQRGDRGGGSSSRCWSMEDEQWKRKGKEEVKIDACLFVFYTVPGPSTDSSKT